jgi:hypothetical protein
MRNFFAPNIGTLGRIVRGTCGLALLIGGMFACGYAWWASVALLLSGGFVLYEAARGWCVMRACGIRTKI